MHGTRIVNVCGIELVAGLYCDYMNKAVKCSKSVLIVMWYYTTQPFEMLGSKKMARIISLNMMTNL